MAAVAVAALAGLVWFLRRTLRRPDHAPALRADALSGGLNDAAIANARALWVERILDRDLFEKVALLALLITIFSNIIPTMATRPVFITLEVLVFIVVNTAVSHLLARCGQTFASCIVHLLVVLGVNFAFMFLASFIPGVRVNLVKMLFFIPLPPIP